jgi:hypothetical protein
MAEPSRVEMLRIPRQEEVYDREEVLGRDAASVFPNATKKAAIESMEAIKEAIGAKKFISETEVRGRESVGGSAESGGVRVDGGARAACSGGDARACTLCAHARSPSPLRIATLPRAVGGDQKGPRRRKPRGRQPGG